MLTTILKYKFRQTYNSLVRSTVQKKLEWLIPLLLIPYFITLTRTMNGLYGRVFESFGWQGLKMAIGTNSFVICVFVFISTLALTIYRLFQSNDVKFLVSLPISKGSLFVLKLLESVEDTARNIILPLPVIIAFSYTIAKIVSTLWAVTILIGWLAIILQIASLSMIITLILGKITSKSKWATISKIIALASALMLLMIFMRYFQAESQNMIYTGSEKISYMFSFLPASWLIDIIVYGIDDLKQSFLLAIIFVLLTIVLIVLSYLLFNAKFYKILMETSEIEKKKKRQRVKSINYNQRSGIRSFIIKELLTIKREPQMIIRLIIPLIMFPAFALIKDRDPKMQVIYIALIALISTGTYGLTSIGRESKAFALLRSLPIKISMIMWTKFLLSLCLNLIMTFAFTIFMLVMRKFELELLFNIFIFAFGISVFVSAIGLGLSALFPKFDWSNPNRAVSVSGFLGFYFATMFFIATLMLISYSHWYFRVLGVIVWTIISIALIKMGQKRLEKMDFSGF
ncbi:TPA: hypothetical protein ENX78_13575 [Candidatus Poribacteria bacterium]|nr:hypothetical protein [Candidatus Poribacteria bacterium]